MAGRLILDNCQLDLGGHVLLRDGENIAIEPIDYKVLLHLVSSAPDCVSTEQLLQKNWRSTVVGDNSLYQVIGRLRVALGDSARAPRFIQTLSKVGYRFIARIEEAKNPNNGHSWKPNPILVMPFQNYSTNEPNSFVADGLLFELRQKLTKAGVDVTNHESLVQIGSNATPDPMMVETLDARFVLAGAIAQQNERLRVSASLSDLRTNRLLWAETYDCNHASLFDAHSKIAAQITGGITGQHASTANAEYGDIGDEP